MHTARSIQLVVACALVLGCAAPSTPRPPETLTPPVPPGCLADLGGPWVLVTDPSWSYRGTDDGGTLILAVERHWPDGGTPPGPSSAQVVLRRSASGFAGETRAPRMGSAGPACEASIPVEVTSCADGGLILRTVDRLRVDGRCAPVDAAPSDRRTHVLGRPEADAGAIDLRPPAAPTPGR
jgi:hypothetical protein